MSEKSIVLHDNIRNLIYTIRGVQVMIDNDLAMLYQVAVKLLNRAVKRNQERFPQQFMFQLTKDEYGSLKSQIVATNSKNSLRFQNGTSNQSEGRLFKVTKCDFKKFNSFKVAICDL